MSKCAVITGASSGIGYEVARQLVEKGWKVLGVAIDAKEGNVAEGVIPYEADLLEEGVQKKVITEAQNTLGGIDLLVNNAGGSWLGQFADMPTKDIDRVLGLNLRSLMLMCREAIPVLRKSDSAQIINISSVAAHLPMETIAVYCASKAAVLMFSKVLAKELAEIKIRVNALSPTGTDTNMFKSVGTEIDKNQLVPAQEMAQMVILLTELPEHIDFNEIHTIKRFVP